MSDGPQRPDRASLSEPPPALGPGAYLVVASARRDFAESSNSRAAVHLILTDLVLLVRSEDYRADIQSATAFDGIAARPAAAAPPRTRASRRETIWR